MFRNLSGRATGRNRWLFLATGYWFIIFCWVLAPAMQVFVVSRSAFTIVTGKTPFDGHSVPLTHPIWQSLGFLLLVSLPVAGLLYFLGRFGVRYVATVKAGQLPWSSPPEHDRPAKSD